MLKTPKVAVLRGGSKFHDESVSSSLHILSSIKKVGLEPIDIYVDRSLNWWSNGVKQDLHTVFSSVEGFVDTTMHTNEEYHKLANKMGVYNFLPHNSFPLDLDRDNIYRCLRQGNISVPNTEIIRHTMDEKEILQKIKKIWETFHTPLLIRANNRHLREKSFLVRSFSEFVSSVEYFVSKKEDVNVLSYNETDIFSMAILPNYRGEKFYTPIAVKSLNNKKSLPNKDTQVVVFPHWTEKEKNEIKNLINKACDFLSIKEQTLIDFIKNKGKFIIVNIDVHPSLRKDGRFMKSLASTGVEIGHYISEKMK